MDNSKRNVHNSGPLGMLMKQGQIKKIEEESPSFSETNERVASSGAYFKTKAGIEFNAQELIYVDPKECEAWKYANRDASEMGDIDGLIDSIKANKQLQPALVRKHPAPHGNVKFEIIFGRRRHLACLKMGVPFLVLLKEISSTQEAIATQEAENKLRDDVSYYSNAKLYQRLLQDRVFKTEKGLAEKLRISTSSINEIMAFVKIPEPIIKLIPDIHSLSKSFALKIVSLLNQSTEHYEFLRQLAPKIGKSISSPMKLQKQVDKLLNSDSVLSKKTSLTPKIYQARNGKELFKLSINKAGAAQIVFSKAQMKLVDISNVCDKLKELIEKIEVETV